MVHAGVRGDLKSLRVSCLSDQALWWWVETWDVRSEALETWSETGRGPARVRVAYTLKCALRPPEDHGKILHRYVDSAGGNGVLVRGPARVRGSTERWSLSLPVSWHHECGSSGVVHKPRPLKTTECFWCLSAKITSLTNPVSVLRMIWILRF